MNDLQEILDSIDIKSSDDICEGDFADIVSEMMPGWAIETWDMDDWGNTLTRSIVDVITSEIKEGRTEIQYGEWHTGCEDCYFAVLATRKPKD